MKNKYITADLLYPRKNLTKYEVKKGIITEFNYKKNNLLLNANTLDLYLKVDNSNFKKIGKITEDSFKGNGINYVPC